MDVAAAVVAISMIIGTVRVVWKPNKWLKVVFRSRSLAGSRETRSSWDSIESWGSMLLRPAERLNDRQLFEIEKTGLAKQPYELLAIVELVTGPATVTSHTWYTVDQISKIC